MGGDPQPASDVHRRDPTFTSEHAAPAAPPDSAFVWIYEELRAMARSHMSTERLGHTLDATALVNEVFLKLGPRVCGPEDLQAADPRRRSQFFSLAARAMRQVLVDHARTRGRQKRGGDRTRLETSSAHTDVSSAQSPADPMIDAADLAEALTRLETQHPEAAHVVELRYFAGLTEVAIGEIMGVTERTVRRHWTFARAWLHRDLTQNEEHLPP